MQIGLDGVRMLDPSTSKSLRIYPLETITRWEVAILHVLTPIFCLIQSFTSGATTCPLYRSVVVS